MTRRFVFDKLVTDKVIANCHAEPHTIEVNYHTLSGVDLKRELTRKLVEEAREIPIQETVDDEVLDEIADAQTVLDEIIKRYGIEKTDITERQRKRRDKKGDFSKGFFADDVLLRDDSPWIAYFEKDPERYPEIIPDNP